VHKVSVAFGWFEKAANQGDAVAEYSVGSFYIYGWAVAKDYSQALTWFQKAAAQGNVRAEEDLGSIYAGGLGVPKDYAQALAWYQRAADQGFAAAEDNLGLIYEKGLGVPKDSGKALTWFQKAAAQGDAGAEGNIGWMYQNGDGVKQDNAQAIAWYEKAANHGSSLAKSNLAALKKQVSQSTAASTSSQSTATNGDQATSDQQSPNYGPLTFNSDGADFYFAQDGKFALASVNDGTIEIHLHGSSFQIGYNGEQMNICLAPIPFEEVRADPTGYKASCLSGAMSGARAPNSDALPVYTGSKWSDGNSALTDETSMKATPMKGFKSAYQVNQLLFVQAPDKSLGSFRGTLYGYIAVYKQGERSNKDIMPIHLILK
jgi:hypothetical protein